jgi:hypothetical protein
MGHDGGRRSSRTILERMPVSASAEQLSVPTHRAEPPPEFSLGRPTWRPPLTLWVALGLLGIVGVAVWLWLHGVLTAWTPSIAVSALTVAASVTVIPAMRRRETNARIRPRVERVLMDIHGSLYFVVETILIDSAASRQDLIPVTEDLNETLNRLLWEYMICAYKIPSDKSVPRFVINARQFAAQLAQTRESERDVLEPDLIRAMDDFCLIIRRADRDYEAAPDDLLADPPDMATFSILQGVRNFAAIFQRYLPYKLEIGEDTIELAITIGRRASGAGADSKSPNG